MNHRLRELCADTLTFIASKLLEGLLLIGLILMAVVVSEHVVLGSNAESNGSVSLFGAYLAARTYFLLFGYLPLCALAFFVMEIVGGIKTRARLFILNVFVLVVHGTVIGGLSPSPSLAYWLVGTSLLILNLVTTAFVWWPVLSHFRKQTEH